MSHIVLILYSLLTCVSLYMLVRGSQRAFKLSEKRIEELEQKLMGAGEKPSSEVHSIAVSLSHFEDRRIAVAWTIPSGKSKSQIVKSYPSWSERTSVQSRSGTYNWTDRALLSLVGGMSVAAMSSPHGREKPLKHEYQSRRKSA